MTSPSGEQYEIAGGGYRAVVTESGAALRVLEHAGRPLIAGFAQDAVPSAGRGQVLIPWPNRIRDGRYSHDGEDHQLPLSEPSRSNASHGLVRWTSWGLEEHTASSVSLMYRLMAQSGYPWTLDLVLRYDVSGLGLTVTYSATNRSATSAPYAAGMHPYLCVGDAVVDRLELLLPAATRLLSDERKLPTGREPVEGTAYDFRVTRPVRDTVLDEAFTDLVRDPDGRATAELRDASGRGVALWVDQRHRWLQVYSGDDLPTGKRHSLAVEPMTAPPDAFRSGDDLAILAPGEELTAAWGLAAL